MFYGAGQQAGFMPPAAGGRGMPFSPQQNMVMPGMPAGRPNQFPMQGQQGGRGASNNVQGIPPNAFGLPGQIAFGMQQAGASTFPPQYAQFNQAMAQAQAQYGRGAGGRGQPGIGMQGMPPQMMAGQNVRGRDSRPQYPPQQGRGGMGMNMQQGQMGSFPPQGRGGPQQMNQPPMMPQAAMGMGVPGAEAIMAAPPPQQKQLLGEALFPKIQAVQPKLAGKITGMLLEMDNSELFGL